MRSFRSAVLIFLIVLSLVAVDSLYILNKTGELLALSSKVTLQQNSPSAYEPLLSAWTGCRKVLSLTVNRNDLERAESALYAAVVSQRSGDRAEARVQLIQFRRAVEQIAGRRRFSYDSIF